MKRIHVGVEVADLQQSLDFYSLLFDCAPTVRKADYAKWQLDDPRVNFSISMRGRTPGVNHLGIQVDSDQELAVITGALQAAGETVHHQAQTTCCYAVSNKGWITDPQGIAWETFHTLDQSEKYGSDQVPAMAETAAGCGCPGEADGACC